MSVVDFFNILQKDKSQYLKFYSPDEFSICSVVSTGTFGYCYKVCLKERNETLLIKVFKNLSFTHNQRYQAYINETKSILSEINHPNIVKYIGQGYNDCEPKDCYILMEFIDGCSLHDMLHNLVVDLTQKQKVKYCLDVANGLQYIHRLGLCHLDIKPRNIMIDSMSNLCKLVDFGSSRFEYCAKFKQPISDLKDCGNIKNAICGTIPYMAPELFEYKPITTQCDVYSYGITMWEILYRKIPYENIKDRDTIIFKVVSEKLRPESVEHADKDVNKKYGLLIEHCWDQSPLNRPSADKIITMLQIFL